MMSCGLLDQFFNEITGLQVNEDSGNDEKMREMEMLCKDR